jgi:nucleoside-diphosphate-sugar epimerase
LRGTRNATLERGYWLTRLSAATSQRSLDRFGLALLRGDGRARHSFISSADVADALAVVATAGDALDEVQLRGPEALSWRQVAEVYERVLGRRVRAFRQPTAPLRAVSRAVARRSAATAQLLAAYALVASIDLVYPPDDARRLLGRESVRSTWKRVGRHEHYLLATPGRAPAVDCSPIRERIEPRSRASGPRSRARALRPSSRAAIHCST